MRTLATLAGLAALALPWTSAAAQVLSVDAQSTPAAPTHGYLHMGTARAADGGTLSLNSRYLTLDGRPWLPVMGEFHYVRVPESDWRAELLKMKSAGVDIVSTYVLWDYQEPQPGRFDWSGQRNLRHFVQLCGRLGLKVVVRVGPWDHAEARFGGLPDWVVRSMPTRRDDPVYLHYVKRLYEQIGRQLRGLYWKDDGPVIGIQLENEYNLTGAEQGPAHIATLKRLAREAGMDVPLYTVTGWDNTVFPHHAVVPVFGGYPDQPWSTSTGRLPPRGVYAFRFHSRVSSADDLGAQTRNSHPGDADAVAPHTPFLGAEFGAGVPAMYRRRLVIAPDDVAAMLPVELGSGVNLYGYYMFQGGRNLIAGTTLEENTGIGGYNDTPIISYDFQAPLGQYGQERPVLGYIRPFHYFLQAFGERLAPMTVRVPERTPVSPADLKTPRWSVRSLGESGFIFFNNHVRQYTLPDHRQVQFRIRLPGRTLTVPQVPVDIPDGSYFIWPFNFDMDGAHLRYATAQPLTRLRTRGGPVYVFAATPHIAPVFAFDHGTAVLSGHGRARSADGITTVRIRPGLDATIRLRGDHGRTVTVIVLDPAQARRAWVGPHREHLYLTPDSLYIDGDHLRLRHIGDRRFSLAVFPAPAHPPQASLPLRTLPADGPFARYQATATAYHGTVSVKPLRPALRVPPVRIGGSAHAAMQPAPESYGDAAAWRLQLPPRPLDGVDNVFVRIRYQGDVARLFAGPHMLDDDYFNGRHWDVGLRRFRAHLQHPLTLEVMPLRKDAPIYIQPPYRPTDDVDGQVARLLGVDLVPEYGMSLSLEPLRP